MKSWYFRRLRTMSLPEIIFRGKQYIQKKKEQFFIAGRSPEIVQFSFSESLFYAGNVTYPDFSDTWNVFGKEFNFADEDIDWHRDIYSGKRFPLIFSKNINIRDNSDLSAKNVWEVNRLQFLVQVAFNFRKSDNGYFLNKFIEILSSWIDSNPYLLGINWYSNIEVNIRLITWVICWEILDAGKLITRSENFRNFVITKWIPTVYQHCVYSYNNPSRYSSSNNHLISEYAGLFAASSLWKFDESEKWFRYAKKGLEEEIQRQHSSGINKEEAAEYIQFVTDFFLLSYIIGKRTNNPFSAEFENRLREIVYYIYSFMDCKGNYPHYGDEDDGKCFCLDTDNNFNNFKSLLTSASVLFEDSILKSKSGGYDIKNQFLFGPAGGRTFELIPDSKQVEGSDYYKREGHFIFRKTEDYNEIFLHFDAAPLGFLSIAAHGHADALSFIMHVDGKPLFIDSGTYTYHTQPEWRNYFIGTLAHNTIRVNSKNQALNGGPTLWLKHYNTKVLELKKDDSFESIKATHDGYKSENTEHIREVIFDRKNNEFLINDTVIIKDGRAKNVEIPFHLHPDVEISRKDKNRFLISSVSSRAVEFITDAKLNPVIIKGQTEPDILGWYSESFLKKEPANVIYCQTTINKSSTYKFNIKIK